MKTFQDYVKIHESEGINDPSQSPDMEEHVLKKIIRLAWDRYEPEAKDFFRQLANKDPDVKEQLDKLTKSTDLTNADRLAGAEASGNGEVIVPSLADAGSGDDEGGGGGE